MNLLDYSIVLVYILGFLYLGYYFKTQESGKDYFLGSRNFGWFPLSMSTAATQLSAISFISAPAFVGLKEGGGLKWLTYELAVPLAMIFLMMFLIPPFYRSGIVSVYAYLEKRFDSSTRVLLSIVFQISRAFGTSVMVYTVALILSSVMGMPMVQTILIIGVVTLVYSLQGGMKAVVYGDMIQMIILFAGIVICLGFGLHYLGGWNKLLSQVDPSRLTAVDFSQWGFKEGEEFGFWPMLFGGIFLYTSYYGTDQSQVQRLLSASSIKTVQQTLLCNGLMRFPITLGYCMMGLVIGTFAFSDQTFFSLIPEGKPDLMIPVFIRDYLPHGVIGILIVAIFSAAMSSLSSAINSLSAASMEDIVSKVKKLDNKLYMKYSRLSALFWGLVCIILAFFTGNIADTVIEAVNKIGSVFYGPILATFIAAVLIKKINAKGANAGLILGVLTNVYLWLFVPQVFWFWWNVIGAFVTLIMGYISSMVLTTKGPASENLNLKIEQTGMRYAVILLLFFILIVAFSVFLPQLFN
jgi:solute carrier family 5 (sodium-dependent multivitamin transporter), member 6